MPRAARSLPSASPPLSAERGLAAALLTSLINTTDSVGVELLAEITLAERDPIDPIDRVLRASIARRLLEGAGFEIRPVDAQVRAADPAALRAVRPAIGTRRR